MARIVKKLFAARHTQKGWPLEYVYMYESRFIHPESGERKATYIL